MSLATGTRLGPYEILSPIGAGGMGEVYRARDTRLGRAVAVKILPAEFAQNAQFKVRFEREARTISNLSHPHICTLFDVGENYIVMELLEGESLADRLAKGPLSLNDVLKYGAQIAEALGKAHREGVVHRDLKPGNIMITKSGAKLLDFGLAKTTKVTALSEGPTAQKPLTQEGVILGTFQYMAPEQLGGEEPDARTDIFALGAVLYEMATGKRAFEGKTKTSLIGAIISGEPKPMAELQPLTPPALEHVVRKCLAKDPEDRWQNASDIAEELRWISQSGSQAAIAAPLVMRRRTRERLAMLAIAAVLVTATYFLARRSTPETSPAMHRYSIPSSSAEYRGAALTYISPDGRHLILAAFGIDGVRRFWLREAGSLETRPIAGIEGLGLGPVGHPHFSPDSRFMYFWTDKFLNRIPIQGGTAERLLTRTGDEGWMSVNQAGVIIYNQEHDIMKLTPGGGAPVRLIHPDPSSGEIDFDYPAFLPDGEHFLVLAITRKQGIESGSVVIASTTSQKRITILNVRSRAVYAAPGYLLFGRSKKLFAVPFDARRLKITGPEIAIAENVQQWEDGWLAVSVSNHGVLTYRMRADQTRLLVRDAGGKDLGAIGPTARYSPSGAEISPDGKSLAISVEEPQSGKFDVWLYGLQRSTATRVTFEPENEHTPVWIDNNRIAYTYSALGASTNEIKKRSIDDSSPAGETLVSGSASWPVAPTSRGTLIYNQRQLGEKWEIWEVPLDGSQAARAILGAPYDVEACSLSSDGKWLLYRSNESGRNELYLRRLDGAGAKTQITTTGVGSGYWNADGKSIVYAQGNDLYSVAVRTGGAQPALGEPKRLFGVPNLRGFAMAPAGRFLVGVPAQEENPPTVVMTNWLEVAKKAAGESGKSP